MLSWCIQELRKEAVLNRDVFSATALEAKLEGFDDANIKDYIEKKIETVNNISKPFVPGVASARRIHFWGVHPDSLKILSDDMIQSNFGNELIKDDAFSPYEVIRYCSQYGMTVSDFPKFFAGDPSKNQYPGDYYTAYVDRIKNLDTNPNTITPHLDKRWHKEAYLPDLNPKVITRSQNEIDRAFILGFIYGYFKAAEQDKKSIWCFSGESRTYPVTRDGVDIPSKLYLLHQGLSFNPNVVEQVHTMAKKEKEESIDKRLPISEHQFYKGCMSIEGSGRSENIVNLVLRYPSEAPHIDELNETCERLLEVLLDEIISYFIDSYGKHKENTAKEEASKFIKSLVKQSDVYRKADKKSIVFKSWKTIITGKTK